MYIPFGRQTKHRPLGRVADFCPFCRGFRPFRILQVESVRHFYAFVSLGGAQAVGRSRVCESCDLLSTAPPDTYRSISTDPDADLETLIVETNPDIRRNWASRLLLEERIKTRKLGAGERSNLLLEPFEMASEVLARRNAEGKLDLPSGLGCMTSLFLPIACLALLPVVWTASSDTIQMATIAVTGCCLAFTFLAIVTDARRHAARAILPRLIASLRPLDPSSEEIDQILETYRQTRSPLADVIRPRDVTNGLLEHWE